MTDFVSTRDASCVASCAMAVQGKLGAGGGLLVPKSFVRVDYADMLGDDYAVRAEKLLRAYFVLPKGAAAAAYGEDDPAPTVKLDDNAFLLELAHGKSLSIDDISACIMPALLRGNCEGKLVVPLATRGALGGAIVNSFAGTGIPTAVMYSTHGLTGIQRRILTVNRADNVAVAGVDGDITEVRAAVDEALARYDNAVDVGSANIARILAETVYYISAYCDLVNSGEIKAGELVDFVLPLGGFNRMLAGYYAYRMGLPINKLVCVSDYNDSLCDFISTGVYDVNAEAKRNVKYITANIERLVFETSGRNAELTAERMKELESFGRFSVSEAELDALHGLFAAVRVDSDDVDEAIEYVLDEYGYLLDPHTAAAFAAAEMREFVRPTIILGVADAFKYPRRMLTALGEKAVGEENIDMITRLEDITGMEAPQTVHDLYKIAARSKDEITPAEIADYIRGKIG